MVEAQKEDVMIEVVGMVLIGLGILLSIAGSIWFLVAAFSESPLWGLGVILFSPVGLVFLIAHFDVAAKPTGLSILGTAIAIAGMFLAPQTLQM